MKPLLLKTFMYAAIPALLVCCSTKEEMPVSKDEPEVSLETKAITPESFDWEVVDYMPTPGSQRILVPWAPGNGGLDAFYGTDVLYDHKKADGWKLVYSTFVSSGANLIDPYFVLYNVYRGTLRVYMYVNSLSYTSSSYLENSIMVNGSETSTILDFLGGDMIVPENYTKAFNSIMPKPLNGGAPAMNNQWYMMEYELAYDMRLKNKSARSLRFQLKNDCYNITSIKLGGNAKSEITGSIGATSSTPMDLIKKEIPGTVKGVVGIVGENVLNKLKQEPTQTDSHNNKIGLKNEYFTKLLSGAASLASAYFGGLPGAAASVLNAIIGGKTSSPGQAVSLKANTTIELTGSQTSNGAINAISMFIPGTNIPGNIQGSIPLYDKSLGVVNFYGPNDLYIQEDQYLIFDVAEIGGGEIPFREEHCQRYILFDVGRDNYEQNLVFNPEVTKIADVSVVSEDLILRDLKTGRIDTNITTLYSDWSDCPGHNYSDPYPEYEFGVRFVIKVQPKDGSPATLICKTFKLEEHVRIRKQDIWSAY